MGITSATFKFLRQKRKLLNFRDGHKLKNTKELSRINYIEIEKITGVICARTHQPSSSVCLMTNVQAVAVN